MAGRGETYQGRIDSGLDNAIKTRPNRVPPQVEERRHGSQPEPAPDFVEGNIVARLRTSQIQLGRGFEIEDFLLTQFR